MKTDETPFYLSRVECPVCKTVNEFETIRLGAYTESGRDTDFRPTQREWRNPRYETTNPLLYFMATCSTCFYTREFSRKFREWKDDTAFRTHRQAVVRQRHLAGLADENSLIKRLGSALWPTSYPIETAINKLLLGVLDEMQYDSESNSEIARWYLRIAWLFREMDEGSGHHVSPRSLVHRELSDILDGLSGDITQVRDRLNSLQDVMESHPEGLAATPEDTLGPEQAKAAVQDLIEKARVVSEGADALKILLSRQTDGTVVGEDDSGGDRYGEYSSYAAFLNELQSQSSVIPLDETQALAMSLKHYRDAYREGRDIPHGNAQIQLAYMIGELARRLGRDEEAKEFLMLAARSGREWIHKLNYDQTKTALATHILELAKQQLQRIDEEANATA